MLDFIKNNPDRTRDGISLGTGRRLSTVCGAVTRLMNAGLVKVSGVTLSSVSNKMVEKLVVCHG